MFFLLFTVCGLLLVQFGLVFIWSKISGNSNKHIANIVFGDQGINEEMKEITFYLICPTNATKTKLSFQAT